MPEPGVGPVTGGQETRDGRDFRLDQPVASALRTGLTDVAEEVLERIIAEVPSYSDAFAGPMGDTIRTAVNLGLGGFLELSSREGGTDAHTPLRSLPGPVVEGAYGLGRGEARAGRTMEALLAAYRVGARVAWRGLSEKAVETGMGPQQVLEFAELVFAYIDQLSAASVAGHSDELETTGRVRERLLERLARQLVSGDAAAVVNATARRAEWSPPETLTAVLLPPSRVRGAVTGLASRTLVAADDLPGLDSADTALLLVPDAHRPTLLRALVGRAAVVGPTRPWRQVRVSYDRALRTRAMRTRPRDGEPVDAEDHLARLVLDADADALADLRARALAPLGDVRAASVDNLTETLRAWLLCRGRREEVARLLHVHPQTVRYRVGQLRELYGDALDDPERVLELVLALA